VRVSPSVLDRKMQFHSLRQYVYSHTSIVKYINLLHRPTTQFKVYLLLCTFGCARSELKVVSIDATWQNVLSYKCC
jgi:hypothetical protein